MFDDFLKGIPDAQDFLVRLQKILGGQVRQGSFSLNVCVARRAGDKPEKAIT